jgi:ATP-dependent DNA ligase
LIGLHRYRRTIEALGALKVKSAYLDGELCALDGYGVPVFSRLQAAMDEGSTEVLARAPSTRDRLGTGE